MKKILLLTALSCFLLSCSGEEQTTTFESWRKSEVLYTYPNDNHVGVSRFSPISIVFSNDTDISKVETSLIGPDGSVPTTNKTVTSSVESGETRNSLVIEPLNPLKPGSDYELTFSGARGNGEDVNIPDGILNFSTGLIEKGTKKEITSSESFVINRMIPDGNNFPIMDFSSFRLQFSQPILEKSVSYGDTVNDSILIKDSSGNIVPALTLSKGALLTIDPLEDLSSEQEYKLVINSNLKSSFGLPVQELVYLIKPNSTLPRTKMYQELVDANGAGITSPLTGDVINSVRLKSVVAGEEEVSQQAGIMSAELAFLPNYPHHSPIRIKRGTLLNGSSIGISISGLVPTREDTTGDGVLDSDVESGKIGVTYISDAIGYLIPNQYSDADNAAFRAVIYMDIGLSAESRIANGALNQNLLHVEINGVAIVKDGRLTIDAIGIIEPSLLGLENAHGVISFSIKSLEDQLNVPDIAIDKIAPTLQSWLPGENPDITNTDTPIILTFNESIAPETVFKEGAITLSRRSNIGSNNVPFDIRVDGSSVIINPQSGLIAPSYTINDSKEKVSESSEYTIKINHSLSDLSGNLYDFSGSNPITFSLKEVNTGRVDRDGDTSDTSVSQQELTPPLALSVYPGYPCAVENESAIDLVAKTHNQCAYREDWNGTRLDGDNNVVDQTHDRNGNAVYVYNGDTLPLSIMPENRAISIRFSHDMDEDSLVLDDTASCGSTGGTFYVEKVDSSKNCLEVVPGRLIKSRRKITFQPNKAWEKGAFYRYTLSSVVQNPNCGVNAICSSSGLPLMTEILEGDFGNHGFENGGKDMVIYFEGVESSNHVYTELSGARGGDSNADFVLDTFESGFQSLSKPEVSSSIVIPTDDGYAEANLGTGLFSPGGLLGAGGTLSNLLGQPEGIDPIELKQVNLGCGFTEDAANVVTPIECEREKGVFLTGDLVVDMVGQGKWDHDNNSSTPEIDAVVSNIYPNQIYSSDLFIGAHLDAIERRNVLISSRLKTQVMAVRYKDYDGDGFRDDLIKGYIIEGDSGPEFHTSIDIHFSAPFYEAPDGFLRHSLKAFEFSIDLKGEVKFLPDGRMIIDQVNASDISLPLTLTDTVHVEVCNQLFTRPTTRAICSGLLSPLGLEEIDLVVDLLIDVEILKEGMLLQFVTQPIKQ